VFRELAVIVSLSRVKNEQQSEIRFGQTSKKPIQDLQ
jgi:hypothetical protein